ncbi:uncharacterized protein LOC117640109 [Thrips palmi]|uniref:Uncharacterized protein LOC117640109 n=1 Tax=Thrips palmi TaxID=161013 RepID=A0A6P8Y840_THRPL|nr:uncharacterized protein LOC117640109 [Thrips palmi]
MEDPDPEHVQVLSGMPALRKLRLQGGELWDDAPPLPPQLEHVYLHRASLDQVLSLQRMPRLRSLTLGYSPWKVFPPLPPHHCGLEYLNILGTRRSPTDDHILFSLIRAHSATLQELRIWTGTCKPTNAVMSRYCFYDDLGPRLAQCNLRSLKWLVLTRSSPLARKGSKEELSHCDKACKVQLQSIVDALKQSGAETAVLCSVCHKHRLKQSDFPHDDLLVPGLHHLPEGRLFRFPSKEIAGILESLERVSIPSSDLIQYMDQFTNLLKK